MDVITYAIDNTITYIDHSVNFLELDWVSKLIYATGVMYAQQDTRASVNHLLLVHIVSL